MHQKMKGLESFLLQVKDSYTCFLGSIDIQKDKNGIMELLQTGLIDQFLEVFNSNDDDVLTTYLKPAAKEPI